MQLPIFQIDAFADQLFSGNPAAVCPLEDWISDALMQKIAAENNLSETAFFVGGNGRYDLRWFTPTTEVDLCGHATLAAAYVIFYELETGLGEVRFQTRSGELVVRMQQGELIMDFPAQPPAPCPPPAELLEAIACNPVEVLAATDYLVVCENEEQVRRMKPDLRLLEQLPLRGVIVTARGDDSDFVSRFFGPKAGIDEDPVTGSAHCELTPYWSEKLDKKVLQARQLSARGGSIRCRLDGDRVVMSGTCAKYMQGEIRLNG